MSASSFSASTSCSTDEKEQCMAGSFGIPELVEYLTSMGLRIANVDEEQQIIELAFHGSQGQWRMIVGIQQ